MLTNNNVDRLKILWSTTGKIITYAYSSSRSYTSVFKKISIIDYSNSRLLAERKILIAVYFMITDIVIDECDKEENKMCQMFQLSVGVADH